MTSAEWIWSVFLVHAAALHANQSGTAHKQYQCHDLCGREALDSWRRCIDLRDQASCQRKYVAHGDVHVPCGWRDCGCFADGAELLRCTDIASICHPRVPTTCAELCSFSSLGGGSCDSHSDNQQVCSQSYITRDEFRVPCVWTGCGCVSDGSKLLRCNGFACPTEPPAPTETPSTQVPTPRPTGATPIPSPTMSPTPGESPKCWSPKTRDSNPFAGETLYVNPSYRNHLQSTINISQGKVKQTLLKMQNVPSAFWIDVKTKIHKGNGHPDLSTVQGILEDASRCDPPHLVTFIVYDLPNRDCWALASNGEICCHYGKNVGRTQCEMGANGFYKEQVGGQCVDGLREYKESYIDPFAEVVKMFDGKVPVVLVIEPDSLPNMVTNMKDKRPGNFRGCHDETKVSYMEGIKYAVQKFSETDAFIYVDAAHGGWLGWDADASAFAQLIQRMEIAWKIRGFATNVANYQPTGSKICPTPGTCRGGMGGSDPCCEDDPCGLQTHWNWAHNEVNFVDVIDSKMQAAIPGFHPRFIIDTGRNGRPDARTDCGNWCNPRGNGIGHVPTTETPDARIDALHWLKTPGESDGCTEQLPDGNSCPRFDHMCASSDSIGSQAGEPRAPEAGLWFHHQMQDLAYHGQLGAPWWVELYSSSALQCRAPGGGCAPGLPTRPPTPSPILPPGACTGRDSRCLGKTNRQSCYAIAPACKWTGCCGGSACAARDHNGWMCPSLAESPCTGNANCRWETDRDAS